MEGYDQLTESHSATVDGDNQPADLGSETTRLGTNASLEALQGEEQRRVLDTVSQVRKCGLEGVLALPQLVVCGDQSAGKSSVLEALTEIPFPRNDELCTRFATEITMRNSEKTSLAIKIIPDSQRPTAEKDSLKSFSEKISDFKELPIIIDKAMEVMGISNPSTVSKAFTRDVLNIEIEGPEKPQLSLVDVPGIIQNETKGVTRADVKLVTEITDRYISQPRTICLAVVTATNDIANQGILTKVNDVDPKGDRTLGIITKPDCLSAGSGNEKAYINLARNGNIFLKLGWHVIKNRSFEEGNISFPDRNISEKLFFETSNFKMLPKENVGIDELRQRLCILLFGHIKQELPKLFSDLNDALQEAKSQISTLGQSRSDSQECKDYLMRLSVEFQKVCVAAVGGHYEGSHFSFGSKDRFSLTSVAAIRRLRAMVQKMNVGFAEAIRKHGHTHYVENFNTHGKNDQDDDDYDDNAVAESNEDQEAEEVDDASRASTDTDLSSPLMFDVPQKLSRAAAITWVRKAIVRNRGRELLGNFNPLIISELFWEQSRNWAEMATNYVEDVASVCHRFLEDLLNKTCSKDVHARLWSSHIEDALKTRHDAALRELNLILEDLKGYPINYNHYYTDTLWKRRRDRERKSLSTSLQNATTHTKLPDCQSKHTSASIDIDRALNGYAPNPNMETYSCEEALDGVLAIYKVNQKTFIANVTTQVVERHIVRGLEEIFSPIFVSRLSDADCEAIAAEPATTQRQRAFLEDRIAKLEDGHKVLRRIMRSAT
ncbi:MAG: hypothetical protein Q9160_004409 [Pyrenula sp. 1 TL-2023]